MNNNEKTKLTYDNFFKMVFTSKQKEIKDVVIEFLSNCIGKKIVDYENVDTNILGIVEDDKTQIVDLKILTSTNDTILVEMQRSAEDRLFLYRLSYEGLRIYSNQLKKNQKYNDAKEVYVIAFIEKVGKYNLHRSLKANIVDESQKSLLDMVHFHLFYLLNNKNNSKINVSRFNYEFTLLLTELHSERIKNKKLVDFIKVAKDMGYDKEAWDTIITDARHIYINSLKDESRQEGLKEGKKEGLKEGLFRVANTLNDRNTPIEEIAEITGMNTEQIEEWKKSTK